ncbi:MAG TPA: hypothetical protein VKQ70_05740 [Caulobacteraceae bacterium]|jgi:hypothetical protein|nr:hypothetical protein [Caulobacteraceae bacterium]
MTFDILACIVSLFLLLHIIRLRRLSLGLPLAYLASLLLIHVPGAFAHLVGGDRLDGTEFVEIGIRYTAIAAFCFVGGVWLARRALPPLRAPVPANRRNFAVFCLIGGWVFVYGLSELAHIPSLGAAINSGGAVWMLGALLGLRAAFEAQDLQRILIWCGALAVYPVIMLLSGGFVSYGSAAVMIVISVLAILARNYWRAVTGIVVASLVGLTLFVNYFEHRDDIRESVWGGASMENRLGSVGQVFTNFHLIDLGSDKDLMALDQRLNQNLFVGLAVTRINDGEVEYLNGQSVIDGMLSLVPRAFWADKPVTGGSGNIVADMTGLQLNEDTSWGVGNVMEFYINFGLAGLVVGFVSLGWLIGFLDLRAASAERRGDLKEVFVYFLPAVAVIQPGASIVEISGSAGAALVVAYGWRWLWKLREPPRRAVAARAVPTQLPPRIGSAT